MTNIKTSPDAATGSTTAENILGNEMYGRTVSTGETTIGGKKVRCIRVSSPVEAVRSIHTIFGLLDWVNQYYYYEYCRMREVAVMWREESLDFDPCFTFAIDMVLNGSILSRRYSSIL